MSGRPPNCTTVALHRWRRSSAGRPNRIVRRQLSLPNGKRVDVEDRRHRTRIEPEPLREALYNQDDSHLTAGVLIENWCERRAMAGEDGMPFSERYMGKNQTKNRHLQMTALSAEHYPGYDPAWLNAQYSEAQRLNRERKTRATRESLDVPVVRAKPPAPANDIRQSSGPDLHRKESSSVAAGGDAVARPDERLRRDSISQIPFSHSPNAVNSVTEWTTEASRNFHAHPDGVYRNAFVAAPGSRSGITPHRRTDGLLRCCHPEYLDGAQQNAEYRRNGNMYDVFRGPDQQQ